MSILDMWGFEWGQADQTANYEGITFTTNSFNYENNPSPSGNSAFYLRTLNNAQAEGVVYPSALPSGSEFWLHFLWQVDAFDASNDQMYVGWYQGANEMGHVQLQDNTGLAEIEIGSNPIVAKDNVLETVTIAGDVTGLVAVGSQIRIEGSLGDNGNHTVQSLSYSAPNTTITVTGNIIDASATGTLNYRTTASSAKAIVGLSRWRRVHVHVDLQNTATGFVRVYYDGDFSTPVFEISSVTTNPSSLTMDSLRISLSNNGTYIDDLVLMDPLDATGITDPEKIAHLTISGKSPDADGTYTDWTATPGAGADYEDINDVPPDDASYIQATATSQASTFSFEAADTANSILAVKWKGKFLRSDTVAGANMNIRQRDVSGATDYDTADIPVPGDGFIFRTFDQQPAGGDWTPTDFDDTEFGVVSKT